jgi:hypothetical protein
MEPLDHGNAGLDLWYLAATNAWANFNLRAGFEVVGLQTARPKSA